MSDKLNRNPLLKGLLVCAAVALAFAVGFFGMKLLDPEGSAQKDGVSGETEILIDDDPLIVDELPDLNHDDQDGSSSENGGGTSESGESSSDSGEESSESSSEENQSESSASDESSEASSETAEQDGGEPVITDSPLGPNETEILP